MIKQTLRKVAEKIPLSFYMSIIKRDVLGLYYHVVTDEALPHIQHLYAYKTPKMFQNDLIFLAKNFNLITYDELEAHFTVGQKLKPRSLILTFDDGFSECYSIARPLLLKHGIPCVFFIPTDFMDNQGMSSDLKASLCMDRINKLTDSSLQNILKSINIAYDKHLSNGTDFKQWIKSIATIDRTTIDGMCNLLELDVQKYLETYHPYMTTYQIMHLNEDGFMIGAHSTKHQKLSLFNDEEIEESIAYSCNTINSLTGKPHIPFAFPYSADGISRELLRSICFRNPAIGYLFGGGGIGRNEGYVISRMCADHTTDSYGNSSNLPQRIRLAFLEELSLIFHNL